MVYFLMANKLFIYILSLSGTPQFFSQYANVNWVQKETVTAGGQSGILNTDDDREERNQHHDNTQGITYLNPAKDQSTEADTVNPVLSKAEEKPDLVDDPSKRASDSELHLQQTSQKMSRMRLRAVNLKRVAMRNRQMNSVFLMPKLMQSRRRH